ncbi:MAG: hypothetical protein R3E13_10780 [Alphaproteobacteria bacterium]
MGTLKKQLFASFRDVERWIDSQTSEQNQGPVKSAYLREIRTQARYSHLDAAQEWVAIAMNDPAPGSPDDPQKLFDAIIAQLREDPRIANEFVDMLDMRTLVARTQKILQNNSQTNDIVIK